LSNRKRRGKRKSCTQIIEEDKTEALIDYQDAAEVTTTGKYRCRDCGMLFETLEELDLHQRKVHGHIATYPSKGMTL